MTGRTPECEVVAARLLEEDPLALDLAAGTAERLRDPALSEHLRACLSCFRLMTELRDLPYVTALLRSTVDGAAGPEAAFWDNLPGQVADAVTAAKQPRHAVRRWVRRPSVAWTVAGGLAAAAIIALWVARRPAEPAPEMAVAAAAPAAPTAPVEVRDQSDTVDGDEDPAASDLGALGGQDLQALLRQLGQRAPASGPNDEAVAADDDDEDDGDGDGDGDGEATAFDGLASLNTSELRALAQSLGSGWL